MQHSNKVQVVLKCKNCVSNAVPEWDGGLGMASGRGDLTWVLWEGVSDGDVESIG